MNIDKNKLKIGIWYEDRERNVYKNDADEYGRPNEKCETYHVCFPLQVSEQIRAYYTNKNTCRHPLKYRNRTHGWKKGIKGCRCNCCGKEKVGSSLIPFAFMPWKPGSDKYDLFTGNTTLCKQSGKCVVAMVNSGDYELDEALAVMAHACERCMNVLLHKYLNVEDGYEEYSDEWEKANTEYDFCRKSKVNLHL